jgi:hypothetical protein
MHLFFSSHHDLQELTCLGRLLAQTDILDKAKPTVVESDFSHVDLSPDGALRLHNTRYRNHVRTSGRVSIWFFSFVDGLPSLLSSIRASS